MRRRIIVRILALVLSVIFFVSGCGSKRQKNTKTVEETTQEVTKEKKTEHALKNQKVTLEMTKEATKGSTMQAETGTNPETTQQQTESETNPETTQQQTESETNPETTQQQTESKTNSEIMQQQTESDNGNTNLSARNEQNYNIQNNSQKSDDIQEKRTLSECERYGHDYTESTCTEPAKCRRCGVIFGGALGHAYSEIMIEPSPQSDGYTLHTCVRCGQYYTDSYVVYQPLVKESGDAQVYAAIIALQSKYPEGTPWTNDNYYAWKGGIYSGGYGCAAFAFEASDAAFGNRPTKIIKDISNIENEIRIGDIIRLYDDTHSVIVLSKTNTGVIVAEGNYNSSVHWGREISFEEIKNSGVYYMTRY